MKNEISLIKCSLLGKSLNLPQILINEEIKNILIVKLDHIGDFILSLPAIKLMKEKFPDAKITLLVGTWNLPIANRLAEVDEVMSFDFFRRQSEEGFMPGIMERAPKFKQELLSRKFDLAIDLRRHHETRGFLLMSGAKYKVGYLTEDERINPHLYHPPILPEEFTSGYVPHISRQMYDLVDSINQPTLNQMTMPLLKFTPEERESAYRLIKYIDEELLIGINPGVGTKIRQWPTEYFSELINLFLKDTRVRILLFGSQSEDKLSAEILRDVSDRLRVTNLTGRLSLSKFMLILERCHLFIGNNSGSGHIAASMGAPTLILFSGQVPYTEWHPVGKEVYLARIDMDCAPCYHVWEKQCAQDIGCLKLITPEFVHEKGMGIINERNIKTQG